jgi:hypothetical protein
MIFPLIGTAVAVFKGIVEFTVGAVVSVVRHDSKLHEKLLASGLPVVSLAEVVIVAVYMASGASPDETLGHVTEVTADLRIRS